MIYSRKTGCSRRWFIVGHTDYQTTANIYTHLSKETMKRAGVHPDGVFTRRLNPGAKHDKQSLTGFFGAQTQWAR